MSIFIEFMYFLAFNEILSLQKTSYGLFPFEIITIKVWLLKCIKINVFFDILTFASQKYCFGTENWINFVFFCLKPGSISLKIHIFAENN